MSDLKNITIEDARIMWRNFKGEEKPMNQAGKRNFVIFLDEKLAAYMLAHGWNVKHTKVREEGDTAEPFLPVEVQYKKGRPPRVVMISSTGRVDLGEEEVAMLDWVQIAKADVVLNPYPYDFNGNKGVKAYLKTLYVTLEEDELERKYAVVDDPEGQAVSPDDTFHDNIDD